VLDRSSTILLLVELSIPSIRAARRALEVFDRLHFTDIQDRVKVVVNRYSGARGFITLDQLFEALQVRAFHSIQNDYRRVFGSVNAGRSLCQEDPDAPSAKDILSLAAKLVGREVPATPAEENIRRGLFGRKVLR
jgi:pilus assembly protein CpaE